MPVTPRDPLLAAARVVLFVAMGSTLLGAAAFATGFVAVVATRAGILAAFLGADLAPGTVGIVLGVLALLTVSSALSFYFVRHLYRIVGTVGEGDPFIPVNAERFRSMGWIALAVDVLLLGVAALAHEAENHRTGGIEINFAFSGLLLALVLFVIARVFREGTRMREELEGTV
jgi:hypothetical protein